MSKVCICDICKKRFNENELVGININFSNLPDDRILFDVCEDCRKNFRSFILDVLKSNSVQFISVNCNEKGNDNKEINEEFFKYVKDVFERINKDFFGDVIDRRKIQ